MALSIRQREALRRLPGYVTNPLAVRYRSARGIEQKHRIGDVEITLPPDHSLPFYQRRDPTYDAYAIPLLAAVAEVPRTVTVIDVGANVGDTAAAVLTSSPTTKVISVEGAETFLPYLRRNLAPYADRARVVEGFAGPIGQAVTFERTGSTGRFRPSSEADGPDAWVTPESLLAMVEPDAFVVWKSDIDGYDVHLLADHWQSIDPRCDVVWFEYDTPRTLGDRGDVERLADQITASERALLVYDNIGRLMLRLPPGDGQALVQLSAWLNRQYEGHITVPYLDVWALTPTAMELIAPAL